MSYERFSGYIDACIRAVGECERCIIASLEEDNVKKMARCIQLNRYCVDICRTVITFITRGDHFGEYFVMRLCALCAEICDACADECEKHNMEYCTRCATACRECARECRRMRYSPTL